MDSPDSRRKGIQLMLAHRARLVALLSAIGGVGLAWGPGPRSLEEIRRWGECEAKAAARTPAGMHPKRISPQRDWATPVHRVAESGLPADWTAQALLCPETLLSRLATVRNTCRKATQPRRLLTRQGVHEEALRQPVRKLCLRPSLRTTLP